MSFLYRMIISAMITCLIVCVLYNLVHRGPLEEISRSNQPVSNTAISKELEKIQRLQDPEIPQRPQPEMKPQQPEMKPQQPEMKPQQPGIPQQPQPKMKPQPQPEIKPEPQPEIPQRPQPEMEPQQPEMKPQQPEMKPQQPEDDLFLTKPDVPVVDLPSKQPGIETPLSEISTVQQPQPPANYTVMIGKLERVQKEQSIGWRGEGLCTFPDGTILGINFMRQNPLGEYTIGQKMVEVQAGKFFIFWGYYHRPLPPGRYSITVFFSPQMQQKKVQGTFQEYTIPFELEPEKYTVAFNKTKSKVDQMIQEIGQMKLRIQRDYESSLEAQRPDRWNYGQAGRKSLLGRLRGLEEQYRNEYVVPFFQSPNQSIYPLLNLLEDMEETAGSNLQKRLEFRCNSYLLAFQDRWLGLLAQFRYEAMSMAPDIRVLLPLEITLFCKQIQEHRETILSEQSIAPATTESDHAMTAILEFVPGLEQLRQQLQNLPTDEEFGKQSIRWMLQVQSLWNKIVLFPEPWPDRPLYDHWVTGLLSEWFPKMNKVPGYMKMELTVDQRWQKIRTSQLKWLQDPKKHQLIIVYECKTLLEQFKTAWTMMETSPESFDHITEASAGILIRQQRMQVFVGLAQNPRFAAWLEEYKMICARLLDLYTQMQSNVSLTELQPQKESLQADLLKLQKAF